MIKGILLIPFWPRKEFAEYCAYDEWSNYKATCISIDEFISDWDWLPNMVEKQKIRPSIFWNRDDSAVLDIQVLLNDLEQELEKY
ncbi:hypothetical protein D3C80_1846990 [compost metagenome]